MPGELAEMIFDPYLQTKNKNGDPIAVLLFPSSKGQSAGKKRQKEGNYGLFLVIVETYSCARKTVIYVVGENGPTPHATS